ncbi:hypothetical protein H5P28_15815 [Ruficoccus amylovorans]|uniref:Uncharacterized protein n=1 Tax=Ruficoccus amylovorans TaxID=1804625 RepID=A0A842HJD1_9BACT|nr:hypothetical protein [Ruficoccus amylovorans]MBC2595734.1 hypothetical protein [Ruficoccus amylovorans]
MKTLKTTKQLLLAALSVISCATAAIGSYQENLSSYKVGSSLYSSNGPWIKFGSGKTKQPAANTATVREQDGIRYISLVAVGDNSINARAFRKVSLPVSATTNNEISADIRYDSPGTPSDVKSLSTITLQAQKDGTYDAASSLTFGLSKEGFLVRLGHGNRLESKAGGIKVDPNAWYRFVIRLTPETGKASFSVYKLNAGQQELVWEGDNLGLPKFSPKEFFSINLNVARPGRSPDQKKSSDFANITVGP